MRLDLKIIPGASKNLLKKTSSGLTAYVTAPANDGKANQALILLLSKEFKTAQSQISITKGLKSRHKTIKIGEV